MTPAQLDPLLHDRALGALAPEVAALLDEHLARDPAAARRAAELAELVRLARAASAGPSLAVPPPLDVARLRAVPRRRTWRLRPAELLRLAACVALGLATGWLAHPPPPSAPLLAAAPAHLVPSDGEPGFWSLRRLTATGRPPSTARAHESSPTSFWHVPVRPSLPHRR